MTDQNKIGIITDTEEINTLIFGYLTTQDIHSIHHKRSNNILSELQEEPVPDALFIDMDSKNIDTAAILPKLHEEYPLLKVVVCSSDYAPHRVRMAMNYGVFDFMPKPLEVEDFNQTLERTVSAVKKLQRNVNDYDEVIAIEHELDVARDIQNSIIPKQDSLSVHLSYEISGRNKAAQKVGGDFFDYFALDGNRLGFVIGDVASKGIPAAIFMAVSRTLFKTIAMRGADPATSLKELNRVLVMESDPSMFIAVLYGILDLANGEIAYSNGGHTHPIIVRSNGSMQILDHAGDMVLGVVEDAEYRLSFENMQPGDILFTPTDGFSELTDLHGKPVGDHFIKRNLIRLRHQSPVQILDAIYESVEQIHPDSRSLNDDLTCLLLKFKTISG